VPYNPLIRWENEGGALDPANAYKPQSEHFCDRAQREAEQRRSIPKPADLPATPDPKE
jgi:hypothetical protein